MDKAATSRMWTPANVVTIIRIAGIPFFVLVMLAPWEQLFANPALALQWKPWISVFMFLVLSFSDFLDGYLARSRNEVTDFGKFMDPLADKLLVAAALLVMTQTGILPSWVLLIVLFREFLVSGLRMVAASKGKVIAASWYGKAKTVTQMIAIVLFILIDSLPALFGEAFAKPVLFTAWFILIVSLVLTVLSMVDYFVKSKDVFIEDDVSKKAACFMSSFLQEDALDLPAVSEEVLKQLAAKTLSRARREKISLGTAESLTGGLISASLTEIPGSSDAFVGGVASYAYSAKERLLSVDGKRLSHEGAVNEWTALQMAQGAQAILGCDIAVAVTGIAGPGGQEPGKPVGTVWMAICSERLIATRKFIFSGSRETVRMKTTAAALCMLQKEIDVLPS